MGPIGPALPVLAIEGLFVSHVFRDFLSEDGIFGGWRVPTKCSLDQDGPIDVTDGHTYVRTYGQNHVF